MTRENISQTSLTLDNGATVHFLTNRDLLQPIKENNKTMKIHCSGTIFDQAMLGRLQDDLNHLLLPIGGVCITKDDIANLLSMRNLVKDGYQVIIDSDEFQINLQVLWLY